jgi:hypothetical protein
MPRFPLTLRWPLLCTALLCSCRPPDRVEVGEDFREPFRDEEEPRGPLSDQQRFAENMAQQILSWRTPDGWNMVTATEFRNINFTFGPNREGECYLSLISAEGGGLLENFNRWRKQMGLTDFTAEDLAKLPMKKILLRDAPTLDLTGTYDPGMMAGGTGPKPDWRMVGTIFEAPGALFTIKMTGPKDLVAQNLAAYDTFLSSLGPGSAAALQ